MFSIVIATCQLVLVGSAVATFVGICCPPHLRAQTGRSWAWILFPCLIAGLIWYLLLKLSKPEDWDLERVNDLVQGSIEASVTELKDAFNHFKAMPEIQIVEVKESLEEFQKVTVNYVYD